MDSSSEHLISAEKLQTISYCYILPTICLVGIVGNVSNLVTLCTPRLNANTYKYLRGLAIADMQCMLSVLIFVFHEIAPKIPTLAHLNDYYMDAWYRAHLMLPLINWPVSAATLIIVSITVDRYISVCWPLYFRLDWNSPKRTWIVMLTAYCLSFILYIPMSFEMDVVQLVKREENITVFTTNYTQMKQTALGNTYILTREIILKIIPILVVAVLNVLIIISLRKRRELRIRLNGHNVTSRSQRDNKSLLYLLGGISVIFFICKIPAALNLLFINEEVKKQWDYQIFRAVANLLETANQAVNFYVFCLCSSDYRSAFFEKFPCVRNIQSRSVDLREYIHYRLVNKSRSGLHSNFSETENAENHMDGTKKKKVSLQYATNLVKSNHKNRAKSESEVKFSRCNIRADSPIAAIGGRKNMLTLSPEDVVEYIL